MAEQEALEDEADRIEAGADARDLSVRSSWREECDLEIQDCLELYGSYLIGQTNGMNDALSLPALAAALDLARTPHRERPEIARRLLQIHARVSEIAEMRRRKAANG